MINRKTLLAFLFLSALEGIAALIYLLSISADPKNALLFGYSAFRWLLILAILLAVLILCYAAIQAYGRHQKLQLLIGRMIQSDRAFRTSITILLVLFFVGWVIVWTPLYRFNGISSYIERLEPLFIWVTIFCAQSLVFLGLQRYPIKRNGLRTFWEKERRLIVVFLIIFSIALITWLLIWLTGWGIRPDSMFWNTAGVPITALQILLALMVGIGVYQVERTNFAAKNKLRFDLLFCFGLWILAAILWTALPAQRSFFSPGPYPPNNEVYPYSDAEGYDMGAQFALIGLKYAFGGYVDKPFYTFFLFILHLFTGQNLASLVNLQSIVFAVIPAIAYWLGRSLNNRAAGAATGIMLVFANLNAYQSSIWIQTVHSRMLLSEIPTAMIMMLLTIVLINWFKHGNTKYDPHQAGGLLGLSTLLRHNPWLFLPIIPIFSFFQRAKTWKVRLKEILSFSLAFVICILPWMIRSQLTLGTPWYFLIPFQGVVIENRYNPAINLDNSSSVIPQPETELDSTAAADITIAYPHRSVQSIPSVSETDSGHLAKYHEVINFVATHFFHNIITSAVALPTSLINDNMEHIVRSPNSFWDVNWIGQINLSRIAFLLVDLGILVLGIASLWQKWRLAGIIPILIFFGYNLATAVARTSGGRYIVPVEWVLYLYYAAGLIYIFQSIRNLLIPSPAPETPELENIDVNESRRASRPNSMLRLIPMLTIGLMSLAIPTADLFTPEHFKDTSSQQLAADVKNLIPGISDTNIDLDQFIVQQGAVMLQGISLYPRFYYIGQGEPSTGNLYSAHDYPRLAFRLIGNFGSRDVILPVDRPPEFFPNGIEAFVIGCYNETKVDALSVIIQGADHTGYLYERSPSAPWICPLKEPICDNNQVCK